MIGSALHPIRAWNRFWFTPISARPLGLFRVLYGLITLEHLLLLWADAEPWLCGSGYLRGSEARELAGPWRWSILQYFQDHSHVHAILLITTIAAALVTLGLLTRVAAIALYAGLLTIHHRNLLTISGADVLVVIVAFWLMMAPSGKAFSLDAWVRARRQHRPAAEPLIVPWAQRMLQLQLAFVYLATAVMKLAGTTWGNGTALFDVLSNQEVRRFTLGLIDQPELINLLTFSALFLELALPFLIWFRETRPWMIAGGLLLHLGILFTVNIPVFGELMCALYVLFLTPAELPRGLRSKPGVSDEPFSDQGHHSGLPGPHRRRRAGERSRLSVPAETAVPGPRGAQPPQAATP